MEEEEEEDGGKDGGLRFSVKNNMDHFVIGAFSSSFHSLTANGKRLLFSYLHRDRGNDN